MLASRRSPTWVALIAVVATGCDRSPGETAAREVPPPPAPVADDAVVPLPPAVEPAPARGEVMAAPWLRDAYRVAALRGEDGVYVVGAGTGWLRVFTADGRQLAEHRGEGAAHVLEVVDVDGDGQVEVVVGRGLHRDARNAPASVSVYFSPWRADARVESVPLVETTRAQVVSIAPRDRALYICAYDSKYMVTLLHATRSDDGQWSSETIDRVRVMAGAVPIGDAIAIARTYGATLDADGFVTVAGERLPSTRGARAIATTGDGLVYADGWHRKYGKYAQALITRARRVEGAWVAEVIAHVAERHGYDKLRIGDPDGDGASDAIAAGNGPAITVPLSGEGRTATLGTQDAVDAFPFDIDGDGADEVLLAGESPGIWRRSSP